MSQPAKADIHPPEDTIPPMGSTTFAVGMTSEPPEDSEPADETVLERDSKARPRSGKPKRPGSPHQSPIEKAAAPFRKRPPTS
jgi:hypothetical protein